MKVNPYEPPRQLKPPKNEQIAKRGSCFGAILLLAIGAMVLTCGVSEWVAAWSMAQFRDWDNVIFLGLAIFLVPPVIVLIAVLWWATRTPAKRRH